MQGALDRAGVEPDQVEHILLGSCLAEQIL